MNRNDFTKTSGSFAKTHDGHDAFVPAPLPPALDTAKLVEPLVRAAQKLAELKGASRLAPNPHILIKPLQRREALTSSAMEGTYATFDDMLFEEAGVASDAEPDTREVANYIRALQGASARLQQLPVSHRLLREAHGRLLSGLGSRAAGKLPGEYRRFQNWIGGATIQAASFVPPPPLECLAAMDRLEAYINRPVASASEKLIDLALVHYQFEAIHPFADGNGRVGRMLITLQALQSGLLDQPVLYVSPILEKQKDEYIARMFAVSTRSEWESWIAFFLAVVAESCDNAIAAINRLLALQADYRRRTPSIGRSPNLPKVIDELFNSPITTIPLVQKQLGVSHRAALLIVEKLVAAGILRDMRQGRPNVFIAPEIADIAKPE